MKTGIHLTLKRLMERGRCRDDRLLIAAASGNRAATLAAAKTYGSDAIDADIMARLTAHSRPSTLDAQQGAA